MTRLACAEPKCTCGRAWLRTPKPEPRIEISPPGMAAAGFTLSMRGVPFGFTEVVTITCETQDQLDTLQAGPILHRQPRIAGLSARPRSPWPPPTIFPPPK